MIESLRRFFVAGNRRRIVRKSIHNCPNCGAGIEDMELLSGRIHSRGRDGVQCKIHIRCWACNRFHTYRKPGPDAVVVWVKLQQSRDYRARARMRMEAIRLTDKMGPFRKTAIQGG